MKEIADLISLSIKSIFTKIVRSDHFNVTLLFQAKDKALKEKIIEIHEEYAALVVSAFFEYDHVALLSNEFFRVFGVSIVNSGRSSCSFLIKKKL